MLSQLLIKNVALIDSLAVEFGPGMNCLTGETGAGKSIIIDSINCLLGGRTSRDSIRHGKETASVQGVFLSDNPLVSPVLQEMGIQEEDDHTLILYREFSLSGRNVCRVNGQPATLSMLKRLGEVLLDIHGQHDNQSLLRPESHRKLLDSFAGEALDCLCRPYLKNLENYRGIQDALLRLSGDPLVRERTMELLSYQLDEIRQAGLQEKEEEWLLPRRMVLANTEKISYALEKVYELLHGAEFGTVSINQLFDEVDRELSGITKFGGPYRELLQKWEEIGYLLDDWAGQIRAEKEQAVYQPEELAEIEERLDLLARLKRKYGHSIDEILDFEKKAALQLAELEQSEERCQILRKEQNQLKSTLLNACQKMHQVRQTVSRRLEENVCQQLRELEMPHAKFEVQLDYTPGSEEDPAFGKAGLDQVEFYISANPGEPVKPLAKIASGGELSRIMLAIKTILADVDHIATMIFDEIDIGISGQAARKVGERMKWLSGKHQVICVTHLAQIAAIADSNIFIQKFSQGDHTITLAKTLSPEEKIQEIARLLDGDHASELTLKHAGEMIEKAGQIPFLPTV